MKSPGEFHPLWNMARQWWTQNCDCITNTIAVMVNERYDILRRYWCCMGKMSEFGWRQLSTALSKCTYTTHITLTSAVWVCPPLQPWFFEPSTSISSDELLYCVSHFHRQASAKTWPAHDHISFTPLFIMRCSSGHFPSLFPLSVLPIVHHFHVLQ